MKNTRKYLSAGVALAIALCASVQISGMAKKKRTAPIAQKSAQSATQKSTQPTTTTTTTQSSYNVELPISPFTPEQTRYIMEVAAKLGYSQAEDAIKTYKQQGWLR